MNNKLLGLLIFAFGTLTGCTHAGNPDSLINIRQLPRTGYLNGEPRPNGYPTMQKPPGERSTQGRTGTIFGVIRDTSGNYWLDDGQSTRNYAISGLNPKGFVGVPVMVKGHIDYKNNQINITDITRQEAQK